jgi:hypothetical protein
MEHKKLSNLIVAGLVVLLIPMLSVASQKSKGTKAKKETNIYQVSEKLTPIKLTPGAVNRIHSSEPIQKINAPQALDLEVEYQGNNAFVTLGRKAKQGVIYIITQSGDVFSLEIIPKKGLKARVIQLDSQSRILKENQVKFAELDKETAAVDMIRNAFADTIPDNFNVIQNDREIKAIKHLRIRLRRTVTIDGVPLALNEYLVSLAPLSGIEEMKVDETSFLVPKLTRNPTAICLGKDLEHFVDGKAVLLPGKYLRLFIVEHANN